MSSAKSHSASITMLDGAGSRTPRCGYTSLMKPECHCPACLSEQMATHRPEADRGTGALTREAGRAAA
jgi:hypothetical protein